MRQSKSRKYDIVCQWYIKIWIIVDRCRPALTDDTFLNDNHLCSYQFVYIYVIYLLYVWLDLLIVVWFDNTTFKNILRNL